MAQPGQLINQAPRYVATCSPLSGFSREIEGEGGVFSPGVSAAKARTTHPVAFIPRRVIARQLRRGRFAHRRCDRRCHYRIARSREIAPNRRHVPARNSRAGRLPFYGRAPISGAIDFPGSFRRRRRRCRRLRGGDGADWNSRRRRSYNEVY